jgi:hypothetical protein
MSAVIKTATPFTIEIVLLSALEQMSTEPIVINDTNIHQYKQRSNIKINDIITNRKDYNGFQLFRFNGDVWQLQHDQDEYQTTIISKIHNKYKPVTRFISELNVTYQHCYTSHIETLAAKERDRVEQERIARVEATRLQAIKNATKQGYTVKEKHISGKIQLVLTRSI